MGYAIRISWGSFAHKPLGSPNSNIGGRTGRTTVGALDEMEVEIVNIMLSGAFARGTNPAFVVRTH
jgi:hypothetical protein